MNLLKHLFILFFLIIPLITSAANYYFSSGDGDDSRTPAEAKNPNTPWKTLSKLNTFFSNLQAGDSILFKSGDEFYGSLNITKSGIIFSSYGAGDMPVITGLKQINNWTAISNSIYEADVATPLKSCNVVLIDSVSVAMGRYPNRETGNSGYLTFQNHNGQTSITSNQISTAQNFTGGEVVIRPQRDILDRCKVLSQTSNMIFYTKVSNYVPRNGYGFFFQNHINTLDEYGEWYYNAATKKLDIFFAAQNPSDHVVKVSAVDTVIKAQSRDNLQFINLSFRGANKICIYLLGGSKNVIRNCNFSFAGTDAIYMQGSQKNTIDNCTITDCNSNGIYVANRDKFSANTIKNCTVKNIGTVAGSGESGSSSYQGITVQGIKNVVANNSVDSTGFSGIKFMFGDSNLIKNNAISNFCFIKNDGGGIYTWNYVKTSGVLTAKDYFGNRVTGNMISDAGNSNDGTIYNTVPVTVFGSHGIYLDGNSANLEIDSNSISDCDKGIFVHDNRNDFIHNNTLFNNREAALDVYYDFADLPPVRGLNIKNNIFYSISASELQLRYKTLLNDVAQIGSFDSNYFGNPVIGLNLINASWINNKVNYSQNYSLNTWQGAYGLDLHSNQIGYYMKDYSIDSLGQDKYSNGNYNSDTYNTTCFNKSGTCNSSWVQGVLDGGCYRLSYSFLSTQSTTTTAAINIDTVTAGKNYLLAYSLRGTKDGATVGIYLRSKTTYKNIATPQYRTYSTNRLNDTLLFTPFMSDQNSQLVFKFNDRDSTIYLDNVHIAEARTTINDPRLFALYGTNSSGNDENISLGSDVYTDIYGNIYSGQFTLAPYHSIILFRK